MKKSLFLTTFTLLLFCQITFGQNFSGDWYGVGTVNRKGDHNSYMVELVLKQRGNKINGLFNYYFKTLKVASVVQGYYDAKTKVVEVTATPLLNYKAKSMNSADCPMEGSFTFVIEAKGDTVLRGQFNPIYDYRYTCPAINITFKRVTETPAPEVKEPEKPEVVVHEIKPVKVPVIDTALQLLYRRKFEVIDEIEVESDTLVASLYDNGEIDSDTVSMFYNKKPITRRSMLSDKPITFKLPVNANGVNEISMYAENLGTLPPNTALLIVMDGEKRYEFNLISSYIKNSTIRFKKKKPVLKPQQ